MQKRTTNPRTSRPKRCSGTAIVFSLLALLLILGLVLSGHVLPELVLWSKNAAPVVNLFDWPLLCNDREARPLIPHPESFHSGAFEMVIGIASVDSAHFADRRAAQRDSWFTYPAVATKANQFRGRIYAQYFIGRAYENGYAFSSGLVEEAEEYSDVLALEIKEVERREKSGLVYQPYGVAPEIIMSLKSLAFYCYAEKTYSNAKFVVKADDDQFVRIPMITTTMDVLPSKGVLWARRIVTPHPTQDVSWTFCGTSGMWIGMTRDLLHALNAMPSIQRYGAVGVDGDKVTGETAHHYSLQDMFDKTPLYAEDIPPGVALLTLYGYGNLGKRVNLGYDFHYYVEPFCRFQDNEESRTLWLRYPVTPTSTIIHHATYEEQQLYRRLYPEDLVHPVEFKRGPRRECHGIELMVLTDLCTPPASW